MALMGIQGPALICAGRGEGKTFVHSTATVKGGRLRMRELPHFGLSRKTPVGLSPLVVAIGKERIAIPSNAIQSHCYKQIYTDRSRRSRASVRPLVGQRGDFIYIPI